MGESGTKRFISNTWSLLLGNGLFQVLNILFLLILVRVFDEVSYSCYRQGNLIIMTFSPLFVLGLPMTLSYFLPRTADLAAKKAYVYQTVAILLALGLLAGALMLAFGGWIAEIYNNGLLKPYMWAFAVNFLVAVVYSFYPFYMVSMGKSRRMAVVTVLFAVMKLGTVILSVTVRKQDFLFFISIFSATEVVKLIVVLAQPLYDFRGVKLSVNRLRATGQVKFALPICLTNIVTAFNRNLDKNLTSAFYTTGQFAVYANGAFDVPMINVLRTSIMGAMFPMFSERYSENDQKEKDGIIAMFRKSIVVVAMALIPLTGALMLYSGGAVLLLFSEKYAESAAIFFIYMLLIPTQIADFGSMLIVANRQKATVGYTIFATAALAGLFMLFRQFGFHYVALAAVISQYLLIVLILLKTRSVYGQRSLAGVFPIREVFTLVVITAAFYALFSVINPFVPFGEPQKSLVLGGLYFVTCTIAGVTALRDYRKLFLKSVLRKAAG